MDMSQEYLSNLERGIIAIDCVLRCRFAAMNLAYETDDDAMYAMATSGGLYNARQVFGWAEEQVEEHRRVIRNLRRRKVVNHDHIAYYASLLERFKQLANEVLHTIPDFLEENHYVSDSTESLLYIRRNAMEIINAALLSNPDLSFRPIRGLGTPSLW